MAMAEMEDVPLVSEEKIPSNRRRLVVGAITFLMAMTLSVSLGYVYFHKQHFRIRAGDPSHAKVGFPNQKDVQKLLELLQERHAFLASRPFQSLFHHMFIIFASQFLFPTLHMCRSGPGAVLVPVQETYPDPQIVFKELKSLNVDNSDPENIKFTPKDWCLSCSSKLANLASCPGNRFQILSDPISRQNLLGFLESYRVRGMT